MGATFSKSRNFPAKSGSLLFNCCTKQSGDINELDDVDSKERDKKSIGDVGCYDSVIHKFSHKKVSPSVEPLTIKLSLLQQVIRTLERKLFIEIMRNATLVEKLSNVSYGGPNVPVTNDLGATIEDCGGPLKSFPSEDSDKEYKTLCDKATDAYQSGSFAPAVQFLLQALDLAPSLSCKFDLHYNLGQAHFQLGNNCEAEHHLVSAELIGRELYLVDPQRCAALYIDCLRELVKLKAVRAKQISKTTKELVAEKKTLRADIEKLLLRSPGANGTAYTSPCNSSISFDTQSNIHQVMSGVPPSLGASMAPQLVGDDDMSRACFAIEVDPIPLPSNRGTKRDQSAPSPQKGRVMLSAIAIEPVAVDIVMVTDERFAADCEGSEGSQMSEGSVESGGSDIYEGDLCYEIDQIFED